MTAVRSAINAELTQFGNAVLALSQGFAISGQSGSAAQTDGSQGIDQPSQLQAPANYAARQSRDHQRARPSKKRRRWA